MSWRKNEATATRRRCILNVAALADGAWADPTTSLAGKVFVRLGDASYVAASGTLTNVRKPLVQADDTFTVDDSTDVVTLSTADPATGSGPFRLTTTGTLPAGLATGTDYWWIHTGTKTGKLAATLAGALAGTAIDITDTGTGTHTIADNAATEQLVAGKWLYEATQAEANVDVNEIEVAVLDDTYYAQTFVQIEDSSLLIGDFDNTVMETSAGPKAKTRIQRERIVFSLAIGDAPDSLNASPYRTRNNPGGTSTKDRAEFTMSSGIRTVTNLDGDD